MAAAESEAAQDVARAVDELGAYLVALGARLAAGTGGLGRGLANDGDEAEDELAVKAIAEWRFGVSLAACCTEEEVLSDAEVQRLASWRCPPEEPLPVDLLEAVKRKGAGNLKSLVTALRSAARPGKNAPPPKQSEPEMDFPGVFQHRPGGDGNPDIVAEAGDWDAKFDRLGWITDGSAKSATSRGLKADKQTLGADQASESIRLWLASGNNTLQEDTAVRALDPTQDDWCIESMTLRNLHIMSMRSRSKHRRPAAAKESGGGPAPADSAGAGALGSEINEAEVRGILQDIFGDSWEDAAVGSMQAAAVAPFGAVGASGTREAARRGGKRKKALPQPAHAGASGSAAAVASSPVHRLIEPPQLLKSAMSGGVERGCGRFQDDDDDVMVHLENSRELLRDPFSGPDLLAQPDPVEHCVTDRLGLSSPHLNTWLSHSNILSQQQLFSRTDSRQGSYVPGYLLQQRLPRTFDGSLETMTRERACLAFQASQPHWADDADYRPHQVIPRFA